MEFTPMMVAGIVAVVVIGGIGAYYLVSRDAGEEDGGDGKPNSAPIVEFTFSPSSDIQANVTTVTFDASNTSDPDEKDNDDLTYEWDFGDGEGDTRTTSTTTHIFTAAGNYIVTLRVSDPAGANGTRQETVTVSEEQPPSAQLDPDNRAGDPLWSQSNLRWRIRVLSVEGTDDQLSIKNIYWEIFDPGTEDVKLQGKLEDLESAGCATGGCPNGVYFDEPGNSNPQKQLSENDIVSIAEDGTGGVEDDDIFALWYLSPTGALVGKVVLSAT